MYKINPQDIFCELDKCFFEQKGKPFYYDQIHLTELGAKKVNHKIISIIKKIENK